MGSENCSRSLEKSCLSVFALWSVMALLCFKKETRNELMGLLWQQDAELA